MEEPPPPPPPPARLRAPSALPDEIVEEILLRSPPEDPARLVRAALVCKRWARIVSDLAFRRRFREFHLQRGGAPMLGFLHNERGPNEALSVRFVRTSASCPPLDIQRGWLALDARGGRVLLYRTDKHPGGILVDRDGEASAGIRLAVWDPLSATGHLELPVPNLPRLPRCWNAALLCCNQHGLQDHADGPFRVVLVSTDPYGTFFCVYSSFRPASWSEPAYAAQQPNHCIVEAMCSFLVGNAVYFLFQRRARILKYDLATGDISVIQLPPASHCGLHTVLMTTEDGGLGFARVEGDKLCLWSMEPTPNGSALAMEWTQGREIDIRSLHHMSNLLGFVDGLGIILVQDNGGFFSVDQKSGRIDKLLDNIDLIGGIVPYVSFYTPALGVASTDEGASVNA